MFVCLSVSLWVQCTPDISPQWHYPQCPWIAVDTWTRTDLQNPVTWTHFVHQGDPCWTSHLLPQRRDPLRPSFSVCSSHILARLRRSSLSEYPSTIGWYIQMRVADQRPSPSTLTLMLPTCFSEMPNSYSESPWHRSYLSYMAIVTAAEHLTLLWVFGVLKDT